MKAKIQEAAVFANRRFSFGRRISRTILLGACVCLFTGAFQCQGDEVEADAGRTEGTVPSEIEEREKAWKAELAERANWWSLQPPQHHELPGLTDPAWRAEGVDRFVLSSLEAAGLNPAPRAKPEVLLRRLSFVLTGLPPDPEHVVEFRTAFAADPDKAVENLVEQLLASPHFGERFARHWMDVVRYTDTYGYEWDIPAKGSWEYRDYLIRAFNDDVGFDQLIREQIAGDLLPEPRINDEQGLNESLIGPMFFHLGEHRHGSSLAFNGIHQEMIDNKIDAFSKAFVAMTVACARCHDHKLDAISQADYYALAGVFMTPRWTARSIDAPGKNDAAIAELKRLREEMRSGLGELWLSRGSTLEPIELRKWAIENRASLSGLEWEDIGFPFQQLLKETIWLETRDLRATAAAKETELLVEADGATVLARGEVPERDTYTLQFITAPGQADRLRLEALAHESLGSGGPGRTDRGNFVLSRIRIEVKPISKPGAEDEALREISLESAWADYSQPNYPVASAIDASAKGWAVGLGGNVDRSAHFIFAEPVDLPQGGEWTVIMEFPHGDGHSLGRFRINPGIEAVTGQGIGDEALAGTWTQLVSDWRVTRESREKANEAFEVLTDFAEPGFPDKWSVEGDGLVHGHVSDGEPLIALEGDALVSELLPRGYHTHALSSKLPGALRLPEAEQFPKPIVSLRLAGGEWAGRRAIPQNAFLNEGPLFFDASLSPAWTGIAGTDLKHGVTRVLTEITTASLNSNFPPRTGVARAGKIRLPNEDRGFDKRSWFSVTGIVGQDVSGKPADTLDAFAALYDGEVPASSAEAWSRLSGWLASVVARWAEGAVGPGDVEVLNWMLENHLLANDAASAPELAALVSRYRQVEEAIDYPRSANSMDENGVVAVDYRLNERGDVYQEGLAIRRNFLEVFSSGHEVGSASGSGRLELAQYLSSRESPQTARVFVNRVWQWIFGTGIVATPSDFGKLGGRPSHPELLDWLAIQFMEENWSTKRLVRRLVLSQTFRQSGEVSTAANEHDPDNRLLHHYPTRRLEAEAIRDSLLAVSGRLDPTLYGRPIKPLRKAEDAAKRLFSGPLDGNGRRSLYLEMSIMQPPEFLVGFNLPDLKLPTGRRDVTNVPAQALIMLNDPLVHELAVHWAEQLAVADLASGEETIRTMFLAAFGREPTTVELARWTAASKDTPLSELAHTLFNAKEFIYYR